jgi:hypothetical protein
MANPQCTATAKQTGERCRRTAQPGTTVCRHHGGRAPQVQRAAKRRLALGEATAELDRLGIPVEVDPSEAMLQMVYLAYGAVCASLQWLEKLPADPREWTEQDRYVKELNDQERANTVRWSKACRDAGVEEHRVALAEKQGAMLAEVLRDFLASLSGALIAAGLAQEVIQRVFAQEVPPLVRAALTSASGER